jgi:hypothetical protein
MATFVVVWVVVEILSPPGDLVVPALGAILAVAVAVVSFISLRPLAARPDDAGNGPIDSSPG